jgi:integrase
MIRTIGKLSPARVRTAKPARGRKALMIGDGGGLWLQCTLGDGGHIRRSWTFRYERHGKRREMGLGATHTLGLAEAREKSRLLRLQLLDDIDPLEARQATRRAQLAATARAMPFRDCARLYLDLHQEGWSAKHREQWTSTLRDYVFPAIGELAVADIDQAAILKVIEPIWKTRTVTAARVRGRIESVLDYATASGFRTGDNPARALLAALPKQTKTHRVEHHAALPWQEIPGFMAELRREGSTLAHCLEFIVLTAARTSEATGATWDEIDLKARAWVIPGNRMKAGKEHRVPLPPRALEILSRGPRDGPLVFGAFHNKALPRVLHKLRPGVTTHGFRSAFRDWAREMTSFPDAIVEAALAHTVGNKVVQAYARGDLFDKRRKLMAAWADHCARPAVQQGTVTPIRGTR